VAIEAMKNANSPADSHANSFCKLFMNSTPAGLESQKPASVFMLEKTLFYQLRTRWLQDRDVFQIKTSGGDHRGSWPAPIIDPTSKKP